MATKPLKSIKFPGLDDTYTISQIDDTLSIIGKAADAKVTGDALAEKANINGYYLDMGAGTAEAIQTNIHESDSTPYVFRPTPFNSTRESGDIVGVSVPWNQLVKNPTFTNNNLDNWTITGTATASGGELTWTPSAKNDSVRNLGIRDLNVAGHKILQIVELKSESSRNLSLVFGDNTNFTRILQVSVSSTWGCFSNIYSESTVNNAQLYIGVRDGNDSGYQTISLRNMVVIDLTLALGSSIAGYIYGLESGTAGAGIAKLREWGFFTKPYYAYNAGSIESVNVSKHRMTGLNQWDEEWEAKGIMATTGENDGTAQRIRSKNQIPVFPSTSYYLQFDTTKYSTGRVACYDASGAYLGQSTGWKSVNSPSAFTTPANCYYVRFVFVQANEQYTGGICLNISNAAVNGKYEPYTVNEYPLDPDLTLRGILKLDGSNNLYADGDTYEADGTVPRKYGTITLDGTQTVSGTLNGGYYVVLDDMKKMTVYTDAIRASKLITVSDNGQTLLNDFSVSGYKDNNNSYPTKNWLYLRLDSSYATAAAVKTYLESNPITVIYPLATPTTETADPYNEVQVCSPYGTEEFEDHAYLLGYRDVKIPVGHNTEYMKNIVGAIEGIPLPPTTNGNFKLRCTVASGVPTYSWVSE